VVMVLIRSLGGLPTRGTSFGAKLTASPSSTASIEFDASKSVFLLRSAVVIWLKPSAHVK